MLDKHTHSHNLKAYKLFQLLYTKKMELVWLTISAISQ